MEGQDPSPQTTLLILLGASQWPFSPEFQGSEAFANAARRLRAYFLNPRPFGLSAENLLDLFDTNDSADELDRKIGQFLQERIAAMKTAGNAARDLLVYFIGHGGFVGHDHEFCLAIRRTRAENPRVSSIQITVLAETVREKARHLRRIIILDCCFAAAAFSAFQSGPAQVAIAKTVDAFEVRRKIAGFPIKGTTLLCSSDHKSPSLLMPDGSSTMFTKAFVDVLLHGTSSQQDLLTLRDVEETAWDLLSDIPDAPRPAVHSPDQSEGDIADIPFFPNCRNQYTLKLLLVIPIQESIEEVEWVWGNHYLFIAYQNLNMQIIDVQTGKTVFFSLFPRYFSIYDVTVFWEKEGCTVNFPEGTISLSESSTGDLFLMDRRTGKPIAYITGDTVLASSVEEKYKGFAAFIQSPKGKMVTTLANSLVVKSDAGWSDPERFKMYVNSSLVEIILNRISSLGENRISFCPPQWQLVAVAKEDKKPRGIYQIEVYQVISH